MRAKGAVIPALLVALMLYATGCAKSGADDPVATATDSAPASNRQTAQPSTAQTPSATASRSATPTARSDPNAPSGQCADDDLAVTVQSDPEGSGAGQRETFVLFRNSGSTSCRLQGFPGVSLVGDGNGTQIGAAATKSGPATKVVTLAPGDAAAAALQYPYIDKNGGAYGTGSGSTPDPECAAKHVDGYRVYPPHGFRAFFVRVADLYGCSTSVQTLGVTSVKPASALSLR